MVTCTGGTDSFRYPATVIEYARQADQPAARTRSRALPGARLEQVSRLTPGTLRLIIGAHFGALRQIPLASKKAPWVWGLAKSHGGVTGSASICQDQSAFSG